MTRLGQTLLLAKWEFRRYFKWRDLLISIGISVGLMIVIVVLGVLFTAAASQVEAARIAVVGSAPFELPEATGDFTLVEDVADPAAALEAEEIDGYLEFESADRGRIVCANEGAWLDALDAALSNARSEARLRGYGLDRDALDDILAPFELERGAAPIDPDHTGAEHAAPGRVSSRAEKFIAIGFMIVMLMGLMAGTSYLFVGITSEKQARVTEQIVAAVPSQLWIDGKILGIAARSTVSMIGLTASSVIWLFAWAIFVSKGSSSLLDELEPLRLLAFASLAVLGFALWFCYFAALAATIDDPASSSRGMLMFVPMLPLVFLLPVYQDPSGILATIISVIPITSPMALPMRMVLSEVGWWEFPVAVILLVGAIWLTRRGAGKVFALGILMHGKEPTWRDIWRAFRAG